MKKTFFFLLALILATTTFAHEYVLLAYEFVVKKGDTLEFHLFVADGFNIQLERPFQESKTVNFELINENGKTDLLPKLKAGSLPILEMEVDFKGLGLFHMERDYSRVSLPNEEFKSYLKGDNIENIQINDSTKTEQTEMYTRYIKSLVQSDLKSNDDIYKKVVGQKFEIILLQDPYRMKEGEWIQAKVLFNGEPLKDKAITARNRKGNEPAVYQYSRTDEDGICSFKLERSGDWFIHATHMIASPEQTNTDWESFWATYSFGMMDSEG